MSHACIDSCIDIGHMHVYMKTTHHMHACRVYTHTHNHKLIGELVTQKHPMETRTWESIRVSVFKLVLGLAGHRSADRLWGIIL